MSTNNLIIIIIILFFGSYYIVEIEKKQDNKIYIISMVDVYHHVSFEYIENEKKIENQVSSILELPNEKKRIIKKGFEDNKEVQDLVNYAYKVGGKDFLLTLEGENGLRQRDRKSMMIGSNGHSDWGLCQLNERYHDPFIWDNGKRKNGFSQRFQNPYNQIDYCFEVWNDAIRKGRLKTTFYAYNVRDNKMERFENLD